MAVEAANILKNNSVDFTWYFVGDGPERGNLEHKIAECGLENNIIITGMQKNPYPYMKKAKALIDSGKLGRMLMVEFQYRGYRSHSYYNSSNWKGTKAGDGGGCLMNQGSHGIDAMIYLAGGVKKVCAVCDTMARKIEVEDAACALLEFDSGAHGTLMGTTLSHFPETNSECERIRIEFEHGTVIYADGKTMVYQSLSDEELKTALDRMEEYVRAQSTQ